jgi:hypothetical protein
MDSIILNSNIDLYGNLPYKFVNHFSEYIEIKPNQSISVYSVSLEKPTIYLSTNQRILLRLKLNSSFTDDNPYAINTFTDVFPDEVEILTTINKGEYTAYSLLKEMEKQMNLTFSNYLLNNATRAGTDYQQYNPYVFAARFINGQPLLFLDSYFPTSSFGMEIKANLRRNTVAGIDKAQGDISPSTLTLVDNSWSTYGFSYDTMNLLNGILNLNTKKNIRKSSIYFEIDHVIGDEGDYFFTFSNSSIVYNPANPPNPLTPPPLMVTTDDLNLPLGYIGFLFSFYKVASVNCSTISIYENTA